MLMFIEKDWDKILNRMHKEENISEVAFTTWIKYFKPHKIEGNTFWIIVDRKNIIVPAEWFRKKYRNIISSLMKEVMGIELQVEFIIPDVFD